MGSRRSAFPFSNSPGICSIGRPSLGKTGKIFSGLFHQRSSDLKHQLLSTESSGKSQTSCRTCSTIAVKEQAIASSLTP
jgi:hypothetical protein